MTVEACELWIYQLERRDLVQALAPLLEKAAERGWRCLVRAPSKARMEEVDARLWTFRDESFLAHGTDADPYPEDQPVLLTLGLDNRNRAELLVLLDAVEGGDLSAFRRCVVIFSAADLEPLAAARALWRRARGEGRPATFWRDAEDGWRAEGRG